MSDSEKYYSEEEYDDYDDYLDDELNENDMWDTATGDFTKQYNKLRQQIAPKANTTTAIPATNTKKQISAQQQEQQEQQTIRDKKQLLESQMESLGHLANQLKKSKWRKDDTQR
ncbi:hypothetical protein G6F68_018762 [Rhizopus microsporus]|nr:hypothetical protein G6F68_018762 [Rhizopus microsporus]